MNHLEEKEIWKDIPGYEGKYEIGSLGNVKSLSRRINRKKGFFISKDFILKPTLNTNGYYYVCLCLEGNVKKHRIHQLVAIAFLEHTINGQVLVVNHKNFNKLDNRLENLEIITQRENANQKHLKSSSKYVGVSFCKSNNKWQSSIRTKEKKIHLGYFFTEIEASERYQEALKDLVLGKEINPKNYMKNNLQYLF